MSSPESVRRTPRLFGSSSLASAMQGPSGANVSKLLPRTNWPPELRWALRAETSLSAVMPPIAARAEARSARRMRVPMTSAISAS